MSEQQYPRPIAVVKSEILTTELRATIEGAGYIVVASDDQDAIKIMHPIIIPPSGDLLWPAMLDGLTHSQAARNKFADVLVSALKRRGPKP